LIVYFNSVAYCLILAIIIEVTNSSCLGYRCSRGIDNKS